MGSRNQLFLQLPWIGGVNTSIDEAMIEPHQLTVADNVIFDTRGSRRKRDGINFNWDSLATNSTSVIGIFDYWHGATTKTQNVMAVFSDGKVYSYVNGTATLLTTVGTPWSGTLTSCSMLTYNNKVVIAVSGAGNYPKLWDGTLPMSDVMANYPLKMVSRASAATTRTLVFNLGFPGTVGSMVVVNTVGNANYNGTFTVATVATTTVANDTITYVGVGALTEASTPDILGKAGSYGPQASILREHLGRIFGNDKLNPDRLHYCETGNHNMWLGYGDSGGFDVGIGDGDPLGITGIFPTFKGDTFVGKQTKLYRLTGYSPDMIGIQLISNGIGVESHNSITSIDQEDVVWVSSKGVHSLVASGNYGDFSSTYVSGDIQKTFNDSFDRSRLKFSQAAYLPGINSVAFAVTETSSSGRVNTNATVNNALWLYNINIKAWYRWPDMPCQSIAVVNDVDKRRFYIGGHTGRVAKSFNGSFYDVSAAGVNTAVVFRVVTGQLFPDTNKNGQQTSNPYSFKGFKRLIIYYKPAGTHNLVVNVKIDNFPLDANNSLSFNAVSSSAVLGTTFKLGQSTLGYDVVLGPYAISIDGVGRGCKIEMIEAGLNESIEIQGFGLEYEHNGTGQEVVLGT